MVVGDQYRPFLARQHTEPGDHPPGGVDALVGAGPAEHERPGVSGVGEEVMHRRVDRRGPGDPPGPVRPAGQQDTVLAQRQQDLAGRAELAEPAEHRADGLGHRLVGGDDDLIAVVVVQPDRQALPELAPGGLVPEPGGEPGPDALAGQAGCGQRPSQVGYRCASGLI